MGTGLELGLLGSSAAEGCCCPAPHPVLLTSLDPAASSNSGVVCRSCGRTPRRPSAALGLLFGTVVEPSRGDVMFCQVCARCSGQPDTAAGQCHDQEHSHMPGSLCFAALSTPYFCCAIAQCTRAHAAWQWRTPRARTWASYRWSLVHHAPPRGIHRMCRSCCCASTHPYFSEGENLSVARRVPVCAGSCALACAGASGEERGPWSARLLYLTSTFFWGFRFGFTSFRPRQISNYKLLR